MMPTRTPHRVAHMTVTPFWADLLATLDAFDLLDLLDEHLQKVLVLPMLGHPRFAAGRARCRVRWLSSELALARRRLADLEKDTP
jgi:hypothetical protein